MCKILSLSIAPGYFKKRAIVTNTNFKTIVSFVVFVEFFIVFSAFRLPETRFLHIVYFAQPDNIENSFGIG